MRLIDADAAIDALCKSECGWNNAECRHKDGTDFCVTCDNVRIIKSLPSAQPDIIRCPDCYYNDGTAYCELHFRNVKAKDFCSWAERREVTE